MKPMPANIETEKAFLSAILGQWTDLTEIVKPVDMYSTDNKLIYTALIELGESADPTTLCNKLRENGIDNPEVKISDIMAEMSSARNARQYAIEIKRHAIKRSVIIQATRLLERAYDPCTAVSELEGVEVADVKLSVDESGIFSMESVKPKVLELLANGYEPALTMGWPCIDKFFKTKKGMLNVWTGAPSSGKSEFLDDRNIKMMNLHGWKYCYFSPENYPTEFHVAKLLEKITHRPFFTDSLSNKITAEEVEANITGYNDYLRFIFPTIDKFTLEDILGKFKVCVDKYGVDAVVLDPWNKIGHNIPHGMTEKQYISRSLDLCMDFARRNNVEFNIVAHPTKLKVDEHTGEYCVAKAYDISGASEWFDKPDGIISVYRRYKKDTDKVSVYFQKVRHKYCGVVSGVDMYYERNTGTYHEYTAGGFDE